MNWDACASEAYFLPVAILGSLMRGREGGGRSEGLGHHVLDHRLLCNEVNGCAAGGAGVTCLPCNVIATALSLAIVDPTLPPNLDTGM